jgi:formamidopyrimidine-DNA glycosylase
VNDLKKRLDYGPDALTIKAETMYETLQEKTVPIKSLIMDQKVLSGLGNIYATEALFEAGISPKKPSKELSLKECKKLTSAIHRILKEAIADRGSTISNYMAPKGPGIYQNKHLVYGKKDLCPKCGKPLKSVSVGGRTTVYCEYCQK